MIKLTVFSLYHDSLTNGSYRTGFWILLGITVATTLMQRRDVGA